MEREQFFRLFAGFLRECRPERDLPAPGPDTHLWESGHLDSLTMLEVLAFLEDLNGREIDLSGDFLTGFHTMERIYQTHVVPVAR